MRASLEFQAVLDEWVGLGLPGRMEWRERALWLIPPACSHAWCGRAARFPVQHVAAVADLLKELAREEGYLEVPLDAAATRVEALVADAAGRHPRARIAARRYPHRYP